MSFVALHDGGAWLVKIAEELKAAGLNVNMNDI
jgi:hypothetical protein